MKKIKSLNIIDTNDKSNKRNKAIFNFDDGKNKSILFGSKGSFTFFDGGDEERRKNYLARHSKLNEDWNDITTAGALSRWVLWGNSRNSKEIEKFLKNKFNIVNVKINIKKNRQ